MVVVGSTIIRGERWLILDCGHYIRVEAMDGTCSACNGDRERRARALEEQEREISKERKRRERQERERARRERAQKNQWPKKGPERQSPKPGPSYKPYKGPEPKAQPRPKPQPKESRRVPPVSDGVPFKWRGKERK